MEPVAHPLLLQAQGCRGMANSPPTSHRLLLWLPVCLSHVLQVLTHSYHRFLMKILKAFSGIVVQKIALPLSESERLDGASPWDLYTPAKISSPMYLCRLTSSILFQLSPYLQKPFKFVISWMIFFDGWCDEHVECWDVLHVFWPLGSSLWHVLPSCPGCHMVKRITLLSCSLAKMSLLHLGGLLLHLKMMHHALLLF